MLALKCLYKTVEIKRHIEVLSDLFSLRNLLLGENLGESKCIRCCQ